MDVGDVFNNDVGCCWLKCERDRVQSHNVLTPDKVVNILYTVFIIMPYGST